MPILILYLLSLNFSYAHDNFLYSSERYSSHNDIDESVIKLKRLSPDNNEFYEDIDGKITMEPSLLKVWKNPTRENALRFIEKQKEGAKRGLKVALMISSISGNHSKKFYTEKNIRNTRVKWRNYSIAYYFRSDCPWCKKMNKTTIRQLVFDGCKVTAYQVDNKRLKYISNASITKVASLPQLGFVKDQGDGVPLIIIRNNQTGKSKIIQGFQAVNSLEKITARSLI